MSFLRRKLKRVGSTRLFNAAALPNKSAPAVPPGTRDITLAAPKSVSALLALLSPDDDKLGAVIAGHEAAVTDTLRWLDEKAAFARSGPVMLDCQGLNTMVVPHFSSSGRQPHIHAHVLVEPTVTGLDGRAYPVDWGTLDQALAVASPLYMGALRRNLVDSLGVNWNSEHHESKWQIDGIPEALLSGWPDTTCTLHAIPQTLVVRQY
ncbi:relaxase domain-containing protein [Amycolatopsis japonica]|uniref:relaxase domain-containing protein n=1 Tax=Amycolatopsis japonica TaxID=208439 RepID=UPI00379224FD